MTIKCPYCKKPAKLVKGDEIYPGRASTANKNYYECLPCNAYVGCHPNSTIPLGHLADLELRTARRQVHKQFDEIWRSGRMVRTHAYSWLSRQTGIPYKECHIGMMNKAQCESAVAIVISYKETW